MVLIKRQTCAINSVMKPATMSVMYTYMIHCPRMGCKMPISQSTAPPTVVIMKTPKKNHMTVELQQKHNWHRLLSVLSLTNIFSRAAVSSSLSSLSLSSSSSLPAQAKKQTMNVTSMPSTLISPTSSGIAIFVLVLRAAPPNSEADGEERPLRLSSAALRRDAARDEASEATRPRSLVSSPRRAVSSCRNTASLRLKDLVAACK
mmetsp:Transcript_30015/g.75723  ORF Transcript_30015/g.75723 Transcript_30015/m.75723 type:complete len:204 (+) Transcript_30015:253-864(+)